MSAVVLMGLGLWYDPGELYESRSAAMTQGNASAVNWRCHSRSE